MANAGIRHDIDTTDVCIVANAGIREGITTTAVWTVAGMVGLDRTLIQQTFLRRYIPHGLQVISERFVPKPDCQICEKDQEDEALVMACL